MATPNAAVLGKDPAQAVFDESELASLFGKSLGGTSSAVTQPLLDVAFAEPTNLPPGALGLTPEAQRALQQQQFQQFLQGEVAAGQRELRGVSGGPAAEQQSAIDALLNFFPRREILERGAIRRRGGGGVEEAPVKPPEPPKAPPPPKQFRAAAPEPEAPAGPPPAISRLQRALDKARQFGVEERRRAGAIGALSEGGARIAGAFTGGLGRVTEPGSQEAFERRFGGAKTAEQAFFLELGKTPPGSLESKNTQDLARAAISAWHQGNTAQVKEAMRLLGVRNSAFGTSRGRPATRRALARQEDRLYEQLSERFDVSAMFGVDGSQFGLSSQQILRANLNGKEARELMTELQRGRDPFDIAAEITGLRQLEQFQQEEQRAQAFQRRREEQAILQQDAQRGAA